MAASAIYIFYTILNYYDFEEAFVKSLFIENYLCKWNDSIPRNNQSQYIIHLCYNGVLPHDPQTKPPTINEMKIRSKGRNISLTFEELAEIPDAEWLKKFDASVYDLYPQTISARDSIRRILMGLPLLELPMTDPVASNSSSGNSVSVILPIGTRQHLRQLFNFSGSGLDVHLVFSVGLPKSSGSNVFQRDGFNVTLGGRSGKLYKDTEEYRNMTRRALDEEMRRYGDLIVGNYEDTYFNLTLKMFYTFQWAARFCRPYHPTFVFNDDDFAFNTQKLMEFIRSKSPQQRETLNHGLAVPYNPVHRPRSSLQQWAFSKREIPWPIHLPGRKKTRINKPGKIKDALNSEDIASDDLKYFVIYAQFQQNYNLSVTKFCKWNDSIHHNGQGQYIIHLCYNGVLPHNPRLKPPTINEMKIRSNGRNISLTFEELAEIPDAEWLKKFDASVYDLYPQTISARDSIRRILLGLPLLEHPVYNPTLHYLQVPSKTCPPQTLQHTPGNLSNNASHDVVIIYKSAVYNFHARQHLRQLFNFSGSGLDVHVVFSVGLPKSSGGNVFQRDGFNVTLGGRSGKLYKEYKVYRKKIRRALDDEMI
ncbi:unnamed protein product, partial [Mesocestoides corti]